MHVCYVCIFILLGYTMASSSYHFTYTFPLFLLSVTNLIVNGNVSDICGVII